MRLAPLLLLLIPASASAQLTMTITEEPPMWRIPVPNQIRDLPLQDMKREFYQWASNLNREATERCQKISDDQHAAGLYRTRTAQVSTHHSSTQSSGSPGTLTNGGNGQYGGYFGGGGFYGGSIIAGSTGNGSAGYSNSGGYGGGYFSRQGRSSESDESSMSYVKEFPDHNDNGGGPLTIINPHCAEFWCK